MASSGSCHQQHSRWACHRNVEGPPLGEYLLVALRSEVWELALVASQSGKTTRLIESVNAWDGPAVVSSVKTDLLRATLARRAAVGDVKVFDPIGISGMRCATWCREVVARRTRRRAATRPWRC